MDKQFMDQVMELVRQWPDVIQVALGDAGMLVTMVDGRVLQVTITEVKPG